MFETNENLKLVQRQKLGKAQKGSLHTRNGAGVGLFLLFL
jgi:hypothetical protein